jgi:phosphohistidine phosphatase
MKTLMLLRHAKSSWKDSALDDHDRPLNRRGRRSADLLRAFLKGKNLCPEFVLSSPALRTRQTVEIVFEGAAKPPEVHYEQALYLATVAKLLEIISRNREERNQVVLVGHNPGIEELFFRLTGIDERFPTATMASLALDIEKWSEAEKARSKLEWLVTPKQLEVL